MINIDEVKTARFDLHTRFAGLRLRHRNVLVGQNFRTAMIVDSNGFHVLTRFLRFNSFDCLSCKEQIINLVGWTIDFRFGFSTPVSLTKTERELYVPVYKEKVKKRACLILLLQIDSSNRRPAM